MSHNLKETRKTGSGCSERKFLSLVRRQKRGGALVADDVGRATPPNGAQAFGLATDLAGCARRLACWRVSPRPPRLASGHHNFRSCRQEGCGRLILSQAGAQTPGPAECFYRQRLGVHGARHKALAVGTGALRAGARRNVSVGCGAL